MSIQVGSSNLGVTMQQSAEPATTVAADKCDGPGLGSPDLSTIDDPKLRSLLTGSVPQLDKSPGESTVPEGLGAKLGQIAEATDIYSIMALFQNVAQQARNASRVERQAELQNRVNALSDAASKMRVAACLRLGAGLVTSAAQILTGGLQIAGSSMSMAKLGNATKGASDAASKAAGAAAKSAEAATKAAESASKTAGAANKAASAATKAADAATQAADAASKAAEAAANTTAKVTAANQGLQGLTEVIKSLGSAGASGLEFGAQLADAGKADAERDATLAQSKYEGANEVMQQMRDLIRDVQAKLTDIEQSAHDTRKQILRA